MSSTEFVETTLAPQEEGLVSESVPSLADFAEDPSGALPRGWYKATVIEGYATRKGKQIETVDNPSQNGDSRNLTLALRVEPKNGDPKNLLTRFNYRTSDFNPERLQYIKALREEMKGVKGKWSDSDGQRSSLAIASLGQLEKALGFSFSRTQAGNINPAKIVGQSFEVRLTIDENGYNEVNAYAKLGSYTQSKANGKASA